MAAASRAATPAGAAASSKEQTAVPLQSHPKRSISDYFRWRPVPWFVCFFLGMFLLTKLQLVYNESPCAVLGTQSPVTSSDIKRAFRSLSMCTHPDRLRGRLKRDPTRAESRRGEIIFNRASAAKDQFTKVLKSRKGEQSVQCYEGELEMAVLGLLVQAGRVLGELDVADYLELDTGLVWAVISSEAGIIHTLMIVFWMVFMFGLIKQFFAYLWRIGILRFLLGLLTTVVIGPLPTVVNFVSLPLIRLYVFLAEFMPGVGRQDSAEHAILREPPAEGTGGAPRPTEAADACSAEAARALTARQARDDLPQRNLRRRGLFGQGSDEDESVPERQETDEQRDQRNKDLISGQYQASPPGGGKPVNHGAGPMPEGAFSVVRWCHQEPLKARQEAADAVQFDLLLILTKPVIPLFMLISLGQVLNGFYPSLFIMHALRNWVPKMSCETHHLLCCFFGAVHTLLGVSAQQVEAFSNNADRQVLLLAWSWSLKDVMIVMHMCLLGATVTAVSALGNEPTFSTSFAAGIALRMAMAQDSVRGLHVMGLASSWIESGLYNLGVKLESAEEVVAYSGGGIGDCGGGPFRMLFGDGAGATYSALALKAWLMVMPLLATLQWANRAYQASTLYARRRRFSRLLRIGQRSVLCALGALQCLLIAGAELNASNGALANFWVAMLAGAAGESLLSTYDVRGPVRQIVFLIVFLLI